MVLLGSLNPFTSNGAPLKKITNPTQRSYSADANSNDVPLVHRNFIEGCMRVGLIEFEEGSQQLINLATRCGCSYAGLVKFVETLTPTNEQAFKLFEEYDKQLKDENGFANLDDRVKDIFSSCQS